MCIKCLWSMIFHTTQILRNQKSKYWIPDLSCSSIDWGANITWHLGRLKYPTNYNRNINQSLRSTRWYVNNVGWFRYLFQGKMTMIWNCLVSKYICHYCQFRWFYCIIQSSCNSFSLMQRTANAPSVHRFTSETFFSNHRHSLRKSAKRCLILMKIEVLE